VRTTAVIGTLDYREVFRWQNELGPDDEGCEKAVWHLERHGAVGHLGASEKTCQPVALVCGQSNRLALIVAVLSPLLYSPLADHLRPLLTPRHSLNRVVDRPHMLSVE